MSTNIVSISRHLSVKQAMRALVAQAEENDNISTLFVSDDDGSFYGAIALKDMIVAREDTALDSLISRHFPAVLAHEQIEACLDRLRSYAEASIPVLGEKRRVIGVITTDDIVEAVDDAMGDDYAKLGGLTGEEDLHEPLKTSLKKRLPWLIILLFLGMGVSSVVGLFESVVSQVALIVCFQSSGMFGFCFIKPPFLCCVLSAYHNFARDASQPNPSSTAISSPCGVISTAIPSSSFPA